jgi:signal transduction histidine kinase/ActR/RegA family two-component response regulator
MTIRARLILLLIAATIPLVAIEIHSEFRIRASREAEIGRDASRLLQLMSAEENRMGESIRQLLAALSQVPAVRHRDWPECLDTVNRIFKQIRGYVNLGVADLDGNILCSVVAFPPGATYRKSPIYAAVDTQQDFAVGTYQIGNFAGGKKLLPYSIPWRDDDGKIIGAIWASIDIDWLARQFADRFFSSDVTLLIADANGTILVRLPDQAAWVGKSIGERFMPQIGASTRGIASIVGIDGRPRVLAYNPIKTDPKGIFVGVGISPAPYFAQINAATWQKAWLIAAAFGVALLAIWVGSGALIRRPVDQLLKTTERWREGDLTARAELTDRSTELGRLGVAFNEMAGSLEERQSKQKLAEDALEQVNTNLEHRIKDEVFARQQAQSALQQAQRIEAVGRLTTGVAHDFNNLLTAIAGNLELLALRIAKDERAERLIAAAQRAADRGAKLTQQLLAFSRQQRLASEPLDLNRLVENTRGLLRSTIAQSVRIESQLAENLWPALGDANQIELVVLNLVINARDAMPVGGAITIETANATLPEPSRPEEPKAGDYVMLSVADTGSGIPADVLDHVFEPFFTTKEFGKGSGLGLPQVLGVAQQLGGGIRIDTKLGEGTRVKVYLPRAINVELAAGRDDAQRQRHVPRTDSPAGTILVIDDDSEVRAVTAGMLREAGHTIIEAASGEAAVERMDIEGENIDAVIVDFAMPGMNGVEVARIIRRNWPSVSILFLTGFADIAVLAADAAADEILSKPFRGQDLEEKVAFALRRTSALRAKVF